MLLLPPYPASSPSSSLFFPILSPLLLTAASADSWEPTTCCASFSCRIASLFSLSLLSSSCRRYNALIQTSNLPGGERGRSCWEDGGKEEQEQEEGEEEEQDKGEEEQEQEQNKEEEQE
eukprot:276791-Hanusia_phi.AAC.2